MPSPNGTQSHSPNPSKHQWECLHIQPQHYPEEIAIEWNWSIGLSSNNYLQVGWRSGNQEYSLFLGGSQDRLEWRLRDSLAAASSQSHQSSSLHMVLILRRDSQELQAQFVSNGMVIDSLCLPHSFLSTDTVFLRLGQSGQTAIGAHEMLGFYRGPPLNWGWHSEATPPTLAFTELSLQSDFFGGEPFVELLNTGSEVVNLMGCQLSDPQSHKTAPRSTLLEPGQRICLSTGRSSLPIPYQLWPQFPHFNQAGDTLYLLNPKGEILARTQYRQEHWGLYDSDWGYTLEKACEQWACIDEFNWVASSWPGGSPGKPYPGPCTLDSGLLFNHLPLCLGSENQLWVQQPPNTWGYWEYFQVDNDRQIGHASGTNRWNIVDSTRSLVAKWCSGQSRQLAEAILPIASNHHLFLTEGFIGPQGLDQSFLELYNPSDSILDIADYRLEFRSFMGPPLEQIPLGKLLPVVGSKSLILVAEDPLYLKLPDSLRFTTWTQAWSRWPSGYQSFKVYLCSAQLDLDSLPWPKNALPRRRSLERSTRVSAWQASGDSKGMTPGLYQPRKPFESPKPRISNSLIQESHPECLIQCYSAEPAHRLGLLFASNGLPLTVLFDDDCPAGDFYFVLSRDSLPPLSHSILLIYEQSSMGRKTHRFRLSRLD